MKYIPETALSESIKSENTKLIDENNILVKRVKNAEDKLKHASVGIFADKFIEAYDAVWLLIGGRFGIATGEEKDFLMKY